MHRSLIVRSVALITVLLLGASCSGEEPDSPIAAPESPSRTPNTPTPADGADPTECPPPDLEATYVPAEVRPEEPQPGLGGGPGGPSFENTVHYGDSPGPDGGPAPFINMVRTNERGGPHFPADQARESGTPVPVLEGEGHVIPIEGGWGAFFLHGDAPCDGHEVTAFDLSEEELRRFLRGLEA